MRGWGYKQGGSRRRHPPLLKQGAPPSSKGAGVLIGGGGGDRQGHPHRRPPHPSIPNRDTPLAITTCTPRLKRASYDHRQTVRAQPDHQSAGLHCCHPSGEKGMGRSDAGRTCTAARRGPRAHTRARRTRDHLTHRHHTLAPQRSSSQTLSARRRTRALSTLPRPPHLGRWPTA